MELAIFKLSAKVMYEIEQLRLKNSFVWPLVYLGAEWKPLGFLSKGLILCGLPICLISTQKQQKQFQQREKKSGLHRLTRVRKAALKLKRAGTMHRLDEDLLLEILLFYLQL